MNYTEQRQQQLERARQETFCNQVNVTMEYQSVRDAVAYYNKIYYADVQTPEIAIELLMTEYGHRILVDRCLVGYINMETGAFTGILDVFNGNVSKTFNPKIINIRDYGKIFPDRIGTNLTPSQQ